MQEIHLETFRVGSTAYLGQVRHRIKLELCTWQGMTVAYWANILSSSGIKLTQYNDTSDSKTLTEKKEKFKIK